MDHYAKAYPIFSRMRGIEEAKTMLKSLKRFAKDEVVQERLRIIEFYDTHGEKNNKRGIWSWSGYDLDMEEAVKKQSQQHFLFDSNCSDR